MRKLTIDEIWGYTKRMWKDIAFWKEVLEDKRPVEALKGVWLEENAPEFVNKLEDNCFFCDARTWRCSSTCPGSLVEPNWSCCYSPHNYKKKPAAFYREILRLDAIRTAAPPEHEWVHGDVFEFDALFDYGTMVYLSIIGDEGEEDVVRYVDRMCNPYSELKYYLDSATFLFNINTTIEERDV